MIRGIPLNKTEIFAAYLEKTRVQIESELKKSLPTEWDMPESLRESMMYSLLAGGKRIRPILVLAAAEAVGGIAYIQAAMPVACAIEMIHTYSLIHDDLPPMDNDDYRRGKLTNHKVYGEAMAILAGDALLTHAFQQVVQSSRQYHVPAEQVLAIMDDLSTLAGAKGMVGGQAADMIGEQGITSLEQLQYIHLHKTGDLIVFSLKAGGRVAGATEQQLAALETFGRQIGLAFQIQDDVLDVIGDEQKLGKKTNSDVVMNKVTYPYFIGVEASQQEIERLTQEAKEAINSVDLKNPEQLIGIADYLMKRDH
ncbi:polyprenyl synthetase family protein [Paenibacillus selenitireducens]|uniref:polyprenyl synthetase family protein n=1 Tax=Paenibacillus selenitireducens TaxID=1324314 RepID=UPI000998D842|nr:farnesyl diphosphate synthase [Paenibacillus selenitireducens]